MEEEKQEKKEGNTEMKGGGHNWKGKRQKLNEQRRKLWGKD